MVKRKFYMDLIAWIFFTSVALGLVLNIALLYLAVITRNHAKKLNKEVEAKAKWNKDFADGVITKALLSIDDE